MNPARWWRTLVAVILLAGGNELLAAELVVFLPRAASALTQERILRADPVLAGWEVMVTLRWRTFNEAMNASPGAIAVAPAGILLEPGWTPLRQGVRQGQDQQTCSLVAIDGVDRVAAITRRTVAVVQEAGRDHGAAWLAGAFPGLAPDLTVRPVARTEDLLQVLGLDLVGAAVLGERLTEEARERFPGGVRILARSRPLRLPLAACRGPDPGSQAGILDRLTPASLEALDLSGFIPFTGQAAPWR